MPVASVVARIKAADADIGANAEMEYKIVDGDGFGIFKISVDKDSQEGIITVQKVIFIFVSCEGTIIEIIEKTCLLWWKNVLDTLNGFMGPLLF